jgi:hypothetical protein
MNYRDVTDDESRRILVAARTDIGKGYEEIGMCSGFVCKAIRTVNVHCPTNGSVSTLTGNKNLLRRLLEEESPRAGDVMVFKDTHVGFYDPLPPKGVSQIYKFLSARGSPGRKNNAGVSYGDPTWFNPLPPFYMRAMVIAG